MSTTFPVPGYTEATAKCLDFFGFLKHYITNDGKVWSSFSERWLSLQIVEAKKLKYIYCNLKHNGVGKFALVHRLVALAFIPNPENKPYVNHIDHDGCNNVIDNLAWCTQEENMQHSSLHGRVYGQDREMATKVCELIVAGKRIKEICAILDINESMVEGIYYGYNYKSISKNYTFPRWSHHLTTESVSDVCNYLQLGIYSKADIEIMTGVATRTIWDISKRLIHTDISKDYDFSKYEANASKFSGNNLEEETIKCVCEAIVANPTKSFKDIAALIPCSTSMVQDIFTKKRHAEISANYDFSVKQKLIDDSKISGNLWRIRYCSDFAKAVASTGKTAAELHVLITDPCNAELVAHALPGKTLDRVLRRLELQITNDELALV